MRDLQHLVDRADAGALLAAVDALSSDRRWDDMADLARRCRDAIELGKQLWAVATHIDYRLALEGPPRLAAQVVRPGAGRFALGPLTEVAASGHDWDALCGYLTDPIVAEAVAQERVLRGEDLTGQGGAWLLAGAQLPLRLAAWEPRYALPVYRDRSALFPQPEVATRRWPGDPVPGRSVAPRAPGDAGVRALRDVVEVWASESTGAVDAAAVAGSALQAVCALESVRYGARLAPLTPDEALALMQWAGASGGAHGRRRGGAAGRFAAWWAAAALAGLAWPPAPDVSFSDELGAAVGELRWWRWRAGTAEGGWVLRLAVEDPVDGLAWAVDAADAGDRTPDVVADGAAG